MNLLDVASVLGAGEIRPAAVVRSTPLARFGVLLGVQDTRKIDAGLISATIGAPMSIERTASRLRTYHCRAREALLITGDPRSVISDLELHTMSCGLEGSDVAKSLLESGVTALAFHLATRHPDEFIAWTTGLASPAVELFLTANGREGSVVGRASESEASDDDLGNFFTCQAKEPDGELEDDTIFLEGPPSDFYEILERHYRESYARTARFFTLGHERALVVSLPGADGAWIDELDDESAFQLPDSDDVEFVSDRLVVFHCGCDREKIVQHLVANYGDRPEALFGSAKSTSVSCPRCGVSYEVTPEDYERWQTPGSGRR